MNEYQVARFLWPTVYMHIICFSFVCLFVCLLLLFLSFITAAENAFRPPGRKDVKLIESSRCVSLILEHEAKASSLVARV